MYIAIVYVCRADLTTSSQARVCNLILRYIFKNLTKGFEDERYCAHISLLQHHHTPKLFIPFACTFAIVGKAILIRESDERVSAIGLERKETECDEATRRA